MSAKKNAIRVSILNEEYAIRSETPPEHTKAVAQYLDQAIRKVIASGSVVETNRAVVLAALQITAEMFEAKRKADETDAAIATLSDYVRPLLPPAKRSAGRDRA